MIKIDPHPDNAFDIYKDAVNRCKTPKCKALSLLEPGIKDNYVEYSKLFSLKCIHHMPRHKILDSDANNLKSLYSSQSAVTKKLKTDFKQRLGARRVYWNKCPYCGYEPADTLEHILPKELYPEYAIHALNLIPCCSLCNSHKGVKIKDGSGMPEVINFYYDDPESVEFLGIDITIDTFNYPKFHYYLTFPPTVEPNYKKLIENHFSNLNLLIRFDEEVISKYTEEEVRIMEELKEKTVDKTLDKIRDWMNNYSAQYGKNHYYSVMLRGLVSSPDYKSYLVGLKTKL